jgi:hypothetical protein
MPTPRPASAGRRGPIARRPAKAPTGYRIDERTKFELQAAALYTGCDPTLQSVLDLAVAEFLERLRRSGDSRRRCRTRNESSSSVLGSGDCVPRRLPTSSRTDGVDTTPRDVQVDTQTGVLCGGGRLAGGRATTALCARSHWASALRLGTASAGRAANYASASRLLELTAADCSVIARAVSSILLEGRRPRQRSEGWRFLWELFGGPAAIEDLAASTSTSLQGVSDDPDLAAARALQAVGVAMCRRAGIPLTDCPCFELSATWELEDVLFLVLRLALGDWSGLAIPFTPLAAA